MNRNRKPVRRAHRAQGRRRAAGFTLIEVLVATIIFAFVTAASGFAISVALRSQATMRQRADVLEEIRGLAAVLRADVRTAYASEGNPHTNFYSGGSAPGALLTFTSLSGHMVMPPVAQGEQQSAYAPQPQSDLKTICYAHDPSSGILTRIESLVPGTDAMSMASSLAGAPQTILSRNVVSIAFEFYDAENQSVRQDWSYTNDPNLTQGGQSQDTSLPQSVHVEIELKTPDDRIEHHTLVIPLNTPTPAPAGQAPPAPATTTTGTTGTGGPGANNLNTNSLPGINGLGPRP